MRREPGFVSGPRPAALILSVTMAGVIACTRLPAPPAAPPVTGSEETGGVPGSTASLAVRDSACLTPLYSVEYRVAGADAKRLTDSLERTHRLAIASRGYRDGAEVMFAASLRPGLADTVRQHPAVRDVQRLTAGCVRRTKPTYLSVRDGPPAGVTRTPLALRQLPDAAIGDPGTSELDSMRAAVRSPGDWIALWPSPRPRYPVPDIDFSREMLLVAAAGVRGGHGRTIRVDSAFLARDTLFAVVREYRGGPTCVTTGMEVRPMHAVRADRVDGPVVFIDRPVVERICR